MHAPRLTALATRGGACLALLALLALARAALAIDWYVERPILELTTTMEFEDEKNSGPLRRSSASRDSSNHVLDLKSRGWVYHPALMVFDADLRPEIKQQTSTGSGDIQQEDDARFLGLTLNTTWLQYKPYTVNLLVHRDRSDNHNSLATDTRNENTLYRGRLLLKYDWLPTTVTAERQEQLTSSTFRNARTTHRVKLESRHKTENTKSRLDARYELDDREIRAAAAQSQRLNLNLSNDYRPNERMSLGSGLALSGSDSDTSGTRLEGTVNSRLRVEHRENLSSFYALRLNARSEQDFTATTEDLSAGLSHQLYENLTTSLGGSASKTQLSGGYLNGYGTALNLAYRRKIPWGGVTMNLGHQDRLIDDQNTGTTQVRGEAHTFKTVSIADPFADSDKVITLGSDNVIASTIELTDLAGSPISEIGNYRIEVIGKRTQIVLTTPTTIATGTDVLVNYDAETNPPSKVLTTSHNFGVGLSLFEMLDLRYQIGHTKDNFLSGTRPDDLADDTTQVASAELNWRWSRTRLDWEDRDTQTTPLTRWSASETLSFRPSRRLSFGVGVDYGQGKLKDTGEVSTATGLTFNAAAMPWSRARFHANGHLRLVDSATLSTKDIGLDATLEWRYGAWRPSIKYTLNHQLDRNSGDRRRYNLILFEITRSLDFRRFR